MPTIDVLATWNDGDPHEKTIAKRQGGSYPTWAATAVATVLQDLQDTLPASGSGEPLTHVIVWTFGTPPETITFTARSWSGQQALDDAVAALKDAIVAAGGTVVSG